MLEVELARYLHQPVLDERQIDRLHLLRTDPAPDGMAVPAAVLPPKRKRLEDGLRLLEEGNSDYWHLLGSDNARKELDAFFAATGRRRHRAACAPVDRRA